MVDIRAIIMLPEGLNSKGMLNNNIWPEGEHEGDLETYHLAVSASTKGELSFCWEWSALRMDAWLQDHLPDPFIYLDAKHPSPGPAFHWQLLRPYRGKLIKHKQHSQGFEFNEAKGAIGRAWYDYKIYLDSADDTVCEMVTQVKRTGKVDLPTIEIICVSKKWSSSGASLDDDDSISTASGSEDNQKKVKRAKPGEDSNLNDVILVSSDSEPGDFILPWKRFVSAAPSQAGPGSLFLPNLDDTEIPTASGSSEVVKRITHSQMKTSALTSLPQASSPAPLAHAAEQEKLNFGFSSPPPSKSLWA
ncbi:hypothetical protein K439DRAFT_1614717 [Ramaria rubella]|nr:hypothetical protein K439DRAFT_1614717 [Ramaria rubella]